MAETVIVTELKDLSSVQLTVRVKVGWRVIAAKWFIYLAKWVGGCKVEFLGDKTCHGCEPN